MATLYDLTNNMIELEDLIAEGESDEEQGERAKEIIAAEIENKAKGIVHVLRNIDLQKREIEGRRKAFEKEVEALQKLEEKKENEANKLKEYTKNVMQSRDIKTIKTLYGNMTVKKPTKKIIVTDMSLIPEEFKVSKTTITADKKAIKEYIERTKQEVDGVEVEENTTLLIPRVKEN